MFLKRKICNIKHFIKKDKGILSLKAKTVLSVFLLNMKGLIVFRDAGGVSGTSLCFDRFAKGQGAYGQFKKILQLAEVPTLSLLNYIFDGRKINAVNKAEYVKKQFQRLLYDASANDGKGGLTAMGEEVWGIIEKKENMTRELGIEGKSDFVKKISDIEDGFYKFIYIK